MLIEAQEAIRQIKIHRETFDKFEGLGIDNPYTEGLLQGLTIAESAIVALEGQAMNEIATQNNQ